MHNLTPPLQNFSVKNEIQFHCQNPKTTYSICHLSEAVKKLQKMSADVAILYTVLSWKSNWEVYSGAVSVSTN